MRIVLLELAGLLTKQERHGHLPGHKGQVGVGDLVADDVGVAGLGEVGVDDAGDALDLVAVALDGGGDVLFGVEEGEPGGGYVSTRSVLETFLFVFPLLFFFPRVSFSFSFYADEGGEVKATYQAFWPK